MTTATALKFNIAVNDGERTSVTVFHGSKVLVASKSHKNFEAICAKLAEGVDPEDVNSLVELFDAGEAIIRKFSILSERVMVKGTTVFLDGDPLHGALSDAIIRFNYDGNEDFTPLVKFLDNVSQNPQEHSRENLFRWLNQKSFGITEDGLIMGYKGVKKNYANADPECYLSSSSGHAIVNGEDMRGQIPNRPGTIVQMPRSEVTFDPYNACSTGLHVGTWNYAKNFADLVIRVLVNPRDVVSVPTDSSDAKMRVCRYKVLDKVEAPDKELLFVGDHLEAMTRRAEVVSGKKPSATVKASPGGKIDKPKSRVAGYVAQAEADAAKEAAKPTTRRGAQLRKAGPGAAKKATKKAVAKKAAPVKKAAELVKKAASTKLVKPRTLPKFYEEFTKADFEATPFKTLQWLAGEWEIKVGGRSAADYVAALVKQAKARTKQAAKKVRVKK